MVGIVALVDAEEKDVFQQFKEAVRDLNQDEWVLIRFLRARNHDITNAEFMIRNAVKWRKEIDIENSLKWEFPDCFATDISYHFFGKDYDGAPTLWLPIGKWHGKPLVEGGFGENLLRWGFAMMERGLNVIHEYEAKGNVVVDLEGLTYTQATHIASLKLFYQGCQKVEQCYPEMIKSVMVINAPWVFSFGFNFIKGVISRKTMDKIRIFGSNREEWLGEMLEKFPREDILPEFFSDLNGN